MLGKNNFHLRRLREGEKVTHYAIKKLSVGVASVAVGSFILFGSSNAQAAQVVASQTSTSAPEASQGPEQAQAAEVQASSSVRIYLYANEFNLTIIDTALFYILEI